MHHFVLWSFVAVLAPIVVLAVLKAVFGIFSAPASPIRTSTPPAQGDGWRASR